jgi:hypothetical protein
LVPLSPNWRLRFRFGVPPSGGSATGQCSAPANPGALPAKAGTPNADAARPAKAGTPNSERVCDFEIVHKLADQAALGYLTLSLDKLLNLQLADVGLDADAC